MSCEGGGSARDTHLYGREGGRGEEGDSYPP